MTPQGFDYLRKLLRERSGLVLAAEKQYLAESRLLPVARRNGMTTIDELIDRMKSKVGFAHHASGGSDDHERDFLLP